MRQLSKSFAGYRTVLLYGLLAGVLIAGLKAIEHRWLLVEYSVEIYGGLVAAVFAVVGIWLGLKVTRPTETVVVREVIAPPTTWAVQVSSRLPSWSSASMRRAP
jgi:hypothetical protein